MTQIGLISFYWDKAHLKPLLDLLRALDHQVEVQQWGSSLQDVIQHSNITHWIFSDSEYDIRGGLRFPVLSPDFWGDKHLLFIGYSMHEALYQLGCVVSVHNQFTTGYSTLPNGFQVYRNHRCYVPANDTQVQIIDSTTEWGSSKILTATYQNATFVQWQPEKTPYGCLFLRNFLSSY